MSELTLDLAERVASRGEIHRPVVIAIGARGGTEALRTGHAIARREGCPLAVVSIVEPPPLHRFESNRPPFDPQPVEQLLGERRESVHARLTRLGIVPEAQREIVVHVH
jgi:hypothetical protein